MTITLYGTTELIMVQQRFPVLPDGFWRDKFTRTVTSDREEILFERLDIDNRRLAPFVAPNVQGRVMRSQGFSARTFRPAYVKPKHIVDPTKAIARMIGEPLLGGLSLAQRFDAHVSNNMRLERESIERRWDWLASKAIIDGSVTIVGDAYPSVTVDFNRDASLTATLTGNARWDQVSTADPLSDLETLADDAFHLGNAPITDCVFGTNAWKYFLKNAQVLFLLNNQYRGSSSDFQRTTLVPHSNFQNMGFIGGPTGQFNLWRYSNWYSDTDAEGNLTRREFLNVNEVVGFGGAIDGIQAFGAIMDVDAGFVAEASIFPKMWKEDDPSVVYTMSQSAPLMVPTNPNNSFKVHVIDD
jgi:hypothetical protein